jgi:general secretion pathway protein H
MSRNVETVVRIDPRTGEFGTPNSMHVLPQGMAVAITIAESEKEGEAGGLRFYPDGQSSGGDIVLSLQGRVSRIAVNWLTGEPRISR